MKAAYTRELMPPYAAEPTRPYRKRLPYGDSISRYETLLAAPLEQLQQVLYFTATEGAYDVVAYLLAMGVPPPVCDLLDGDLDGGSLIYLTLKAGHLGVANLLYAHGAPIYSYDCDDGYSYDWDDETQGRSLCRLMEEEVAPAALDLSIRRWLNSLPERAPQVASHRFLPAHGTTNVIPQFAPRLRASVVPSYLPARPRLRPGHRGRSGASTHSTTFDRACAGCAGRGPSTARRTTGARCAGGPRRAPSPSTGWGARSSAPARREARGAPPTCGPSAGTSTGWCRRGVG